MHCVRCYVASENFHCYPDSNEERFVGRVTGADQTGRRNCVFTASAGKEQTEWLIRVVTTIHRRTAEG